MLLALVFIVLDICQLHYIYFVKSLLTYKLFLNAQLDRWLVLLNFNIHVFHFIVPEKPMILNKSYWFWTVNVFQSIELHLDRIGLLFLMEIVLKSVCAFVICPVWHKFQFFRNSSLSQTYTVFHKKNPGTAAFDYVHGDC